MSKLLAGINSPDDLKKLDLDQLKDLAGEIRQEIIATVEKNGGHLGANLGVVELTLALHSVLDSPDDRLIWDVGHQCYPHKLVTGRGKDFDTLRQWGGISGFPSPRENEHDHFGVGHSSTSISAGLGMATARDLRGEDHNVVVVIGDGALTGGMAFEALNHAGSLGTDLIVILNDNEMSITNNVGALSNYLGRLRSDTTLFRARERLVAMIRKIPLIGGPLSKMTRYFHRVSKKILPGQLFEELGFAYFGPFDGHNVAQLKKTITDGINRGGPVLIHVYTKKGRGHALAEEDPARYHGVNPNTAGKKKLTSYSEVFGRTLVNLAQADSRIVAITAAMRDGTGLGEFAKAFPERFFDVGIAEQHALTLAAGLAKEGLRPVVAIYSTFLQRGLDQIIHDIGLQGLPVLMAVDRAGVVGDDGPTHHGVFDLSFLRPVPDLTVLAPSNGNDLSSMMSWALKQMKPVAIRYPRGGTAFHLDYPELPAQAAISAVECKPGTDCLILTLGNMVQQALGAAETLKPRLSCAVVDVRSVKPLDSQFILDRARQCKLVFTVEDHVLTGGLGSAVLELLAAEPDVLVERIGYPDQYVPHGSVDKIWQEFGLDSAGIARRIQQVALGRSRWVLAGRD